MAAKQTKRNPKARWELHSPKLQRLIDWCTILLIAFIAIFLFGILNVTIDLFLGSGVDKLTLYSLIVGFVGTFVSFLVAAFSPIGIFIFKELK
jgi:cation transporter-like permease